MVQAYPAARRLQQAVAYAMLVLLGLVMFGGQASAQGRTPASNHDGAGYHLDIKGVQGQALPKGVKQAEVRKIVDGDTIEIVYPPDDWWYKVRIIGINAPESVKPNTPVQCYGKESSHRLTEIIPTGATVYLERDVSDEDQYGRLLRHVWVVDAGTGQAYLVSELLVRGAMSMPGITRRTTSTTTGWQRRSWRQNMRTTGSGPRVRKTADIIDTAPALRYSHLRAGSLPNGRSIPAIPAQPMNRSSR